jgi:hypothetical protein
VKKAFEVNRKAKYDRPKTILRPNADKTGNNPLPEAAGLMKPKV